MEKTKPLIIFSIIFLTSFALALHTLTPATYENGLGFSFNETLTTNLFNITVNNTFIGAIANITQVNITLPSTFTFISGTNGQGENETLAIFSNTTTVLSWTNASAASFLINGTEAGVAGNWTYFWFNASASTPGTYNITITTVNETSATAFTQYISVEINDTTAPFNVSFSGNTTNINANLSQNYILANATINDTDGAYAGNLTGSLIRYFLYWSNGTLINGTNTTINSDAINFTGLGDGLYFINITANDSRGNYNSTLGSRIIRLDATAPSASASCTPASASQNGVVTCSCSGSDAGSGVSTSSATTTPSTANTGTYTYTCTATDYAGNSASTTATYNVAGASGGNGGTTTTTFWSRGTTTVSNTQLEESFSKALTARQRLRITIDSETHYVGVVELTATTATINISSDPQQAIMQIGDERKFEVTGDNYYDLLVTLNSIESNKADITIVSISEAISEATIAEEKAKDTAGTTAKTEEVPEEESKPWLIPTIIAIIIIVAIVIVYNKSKAKFPSPEGTQEKY